MKRVLCGVLAVVLAIICFVGCQSSARSIEGEWERADASSPLYGAIIKIEKTDDDSYVGKITSLTDVAKDAGFRTGDTKWSEIKATDETNQYSMKDMTINAIDGEKSWSDMILTFDPTNPDEIKIQSVDADPNFFDSNSQTYRRK